MGKVRFYCFALNLFSSFVTGHFSFSFSGNLPWKTLSKKTPAMTNFADTILSAKFPASLEIEMLQYRFLKHKLWNYAFQRKQ